MTLVLIQILVLAWLAYSIWRYPAEETVKVTIQDHRLKRGCLLESSGGHPLNVAFVIDKDTILCGIVGDGKWVKVLKP